MPKFPNSKKVSIFLPDDLHRKIKILCAEQGISMQRFFVERVVYLAPVSNSGVESPLAAPLRAQFSVDKTGVALRIFSTDPEAWAEMVERSGISSKSERTEIPLGINIPKSRQATTRENSENTPLS